MEIRVIANVVQSESSHHVPTPALLQYARFLADDFKSSANAQSGQIAGNPQCGVIGGRLHIILRVEPEDNVDGTGGTQHIGRQKYQKQSDASFHMQVLGAIVVTRAIVKALLIFLVNAVAFAESSLDVTSGL